MPVTTKERLRRRLPGKRKNAIDADLVVERVTTRLEWMRSSVEALWKDPNTAGRPDRYELVMDGNWWRWNILLALSPALFIALYCELIAKPQMLEEKEKTGFLPPSSSSNSILENLSEGFQHYLFGIDPLEGASNPSSSPQSTQQQQDLQQIQELKENIERLEEKFRSQQHHSKIYKRHQAEIHSSKKDEDLSSTTDSEPSPSTTLSTLTNSFMVLTKSLMNFAIDQGISEDVPSLPSREDDGHMAPETTQEIIPMDPELVTIETAPASATIQVTNREESKADSLSHASADEPLKRTGWRWWQSTGGN